MEKRNMSAGEQIPLHVGVSCSDGLCGVSTHVLVDPITRKVTHLVVQEISLQHPEYMVPVEYVTAGSSDAILLRCTRDELRHMDAFVQTHYLYEPMPDYDSAYTEGYSVVVPEVMTQVPVEEEMIPLGELAVRHGMRVKAVDGAVGQVDELLMNPGTSKVTHLVMREGHLWGARDVAIPVSAVEYADDDTVTLRLSKQEIAALPAISIRRPPIPPSLNELVRAH